MYKMRLTNIGMPLLLLSILSLTVPTITHAQPNLSREEIFITGQWLDARKVQFTGAPILLHLRIGHERVLLLPEPVRLSDEGHQASGYIADIDEDIVRIFPLSHFDREPIHLIGLDTNTDYVLRVRASAFGIRQPLQIFLAD